MEKKKRYIVGEEDKAILKTYRLDCPEARMTQVSPGKLMRRERRKKERKNKR